MSTPHPPIISLDIESYGKLAGLPSQTCFTPFRSTFIDGAEVKDLCICLSITIPTFDPRQRASPCEPPPPALPAGAVPAQTKSPTAGPTSSAATADSALSIASRPARGWTAQAISQLRPGPTFNLYPSLYVHHLDMLLAWLSYADTIVGMNLAYDLLNLWYAYPVLRHTLLRSAHTLLDVSYIAFQEYELRPERSLKTLGPLASIFRYDDEDLVEKLPTLDKVARYNREDTHNAILAAAHYAGRIADRQRGLPLPTPAASTTYGRENYHWKLSPYAISTYSLTIDTALSMTRAGLGFSVPATTALLARLDAKITRSESLALRMGLQLSGKGRDTRSNPASRPAFLQSLVDACNAHRPGTDILSEVREGSDPRRPTPLLDFTDKKGDLSFNDYNRAILSSRLPPSAHRLRTLCRLVDIHSSASKLRSTWVFPLLHHHARYGPSDRTCRLVPHSDPSFHPSVAFDHPTWFIVPGRFKNTASGGKDGGTIQARITCQKGPRQTDPPAVQDLYRSRYPSGILVSVDLDQAEVRVPALLSGEPALVRAFTEGLDIHTNRTIDVWGEPELVRRYPVLRGQPAKLWKELCRPFAKRERQVGKRVVLSDGFRAGAATMQHSVLSDIGESFPLPFFQTIVDRRPSDRPVLWAWQERLIATARRDGFLCLPYTGHSRTFAHTETRDSYDINEICNFPVQDTAASILLRVMHLIRPRLARLIEITMNVYDSIIFDLPHPSYLPTLKALLAEVFDHLHTRDYLSWLFSLHSTFVPFTYEVKVLPLSCPSGPVPN